MTETKRLMDDVMGEILEAMPPGPMKARLATLIGAAVRASGLPPEDAWCAVASLVSAAHGDAPTAVVVSFLPEQGDNADRQVVSFSSNGTVGVTPAVVAGAVRDDARMH